MNAAKTVVIETLAAFLMIDSMPPKLMVVIPSMRCVFNDRFNAPKIDGRYTEHALARKTRTVPIKFKD